MNDEELRQLIERVAATLRGMDALGHLKLVADMAESAGRIIDQKLAAHVADAHQDDAALWDSVQRILQAFHIPQRPDDIEGLTFIRRVARALTPAVEEQLASRDGQLDALNRRLDLLTLQVARLRRRRRRRRRP